jgi:hypothetical protein
VRSTSQEKQNLASSLVDSLGGPCENSHVAMRKRHSWPQGSDDEVLHLILYQLLRRAKTSRMLPCKDISVGLKEVTTRSFT